MAFPAIESAVNSSNTAGTSLAVALPATVSAGALLIILGRVSAGGTVSFPAGWTVTQSSADASDDTAYVAYRDTLADGTEDGTTVTVSGYTSGKHAAVSLSITGAEDPATQPPEFAIATGTSTTPDPPNLTPTGGAKDYKWMWLGTWEGEQTSPPAGAPTNYATEGAGQLDANTGTGGVVATNVRVVARQRNLNAASENPPSWTISASDDWTVWTGAVHPAPPAVVPVTGIRRPRAVV